MGRNTESSTRITKKLQTRHLCIISTEDSKLGAYAYLCALRDKYQDKFVVKPSNIIPSRDGKTTPKDVLNRLRAYGYDTSYDTYWVVSDVDNWGHHKLDKVVSDCDKLRGFQTAISNNCFEIWILYHQAGFNKTFARSKDCKRDANILVSRLGSLNDLFDEALLSRAISKAKAMPSANDPWPKSQGSHMYKLIEYLQSGKV